jgi:hypothetical protein
MSESMTTTTPLGAHRFDAVANCSRSAGRVGSTSKSCYFLLFNIIIIISETNRIVEGIRFVSMRLRSFGLS